MSWFDRRCFVSSHCIFLYHCWYVPNERNVQRNRLLRFAKKSFELPVAFFFLVRGVRSLALLLSCFWFLDFESSVVTVIIIFLVFAAMSQPKYALL